MRPVLRNMKLALSFGIVFVCMFIVATTVCLVGRKTCFPGHKAFKASMIGSLERLFQQEVESWPANYEEDAHALKEGLNHHIWEKNCLNTIERLYNFPIFPWAPDQRQFTHRTEVVDKLSSAVVEGHRLFGFLLPDTTDEYQFAVASNGYAEVWLSWNKNWRAARQIAFVGPFDLKTATISKWNFGVSEKQVSSTIHLKAGARYYFEILYTYGTPNNNSETFLQVAWKRLEESNFKIIEGASLALFTNDSQKEKYRIFDDELPDVISCATKHQKGYQNKHMKPDPTPYLEHTELDKALQKCEYRPSYLLDAAKLKDFKRYQGVLRNVQKTYSFPFSTVGGIVQGKEIEIYNSFCAERVLNVQEAWSVVKRYMDALEMSYSGYEGFAC